MGRIITEKVIVETYLLEEEKKKQPRRTFCIQINSEPLLIKMQEEPDLQELQRQNQKILLHFKKLTNF